MEQVTQFDRVQIAASRLLNTVLGGSEREMLSSRCYREGRYWASMVIDSIFFWESHHCFKCYFWELEYERFQKRLTESAKSGAYLDEQIPSNKPGEGKCPSSTACGDQFNTKIQ